MQDANSFMGDKIRELAITRPDLCDESGLGFWPVPATFPSLLSHTLNSLQLRISEEYLNNSESAEVLAKVRMNLMKVTFAGDLGEDHTKLFIADHPSVKNMVDNQIMTLPFFSFCQSVLKETNPIKLLGIMTRNEEGSLGEAKALVETKMIKDGEFARIHLIEEEEHARLSKEIRDLITDDDNFRNDFIEGLELHDKFYSTITNQAGSNVPY